MKELQRHRRIFKILTPFVQSFMKWKFNYEYDDLSEIEGPYLLLANHNMELDPLAVAVASGQHVYFVASEHIMRKGIGTKLLMRYVRPIIHLKGRQGMKTVKEMMKTLKAGQNVCIFPEGNRSFNGITCEMEPSIAKVAKRSGAKLVTFRLEGGYLSQPRWSTTLRRGKLKGRLIQVYTPEKMAEMTDQQMNESICRDLYEDAYETQKKERVAYEGKNLALGMESTVFMCPECKRMGTLGSEDDRFYCRECGFDAVYDVYGDLTEKKGKKYTVTELDRMQQENLGKYLAEYDSEEAIFTDAVKVYEIDKKHIVTNVRDGRLAAYTDRMECCGETFSYKEIEGLSIYSRNSMIIHIKGQSGHLEIKSDLSFNALKYLYLYNIKEKEN